MDSGPHSDRLRARLAALQPEPWKGRGRQGQPSDLRRHVRTVFDELVAAKARGVTWQQLAHAMNEDGIRGSSGALVEWRQMKSLFHAERYERGGKRRKRPKKSAVGRGAPSNVAAASRLAQPASTASAAPATAARGPDALARLRTETNERSRRPADDRVGSPPDHSYGMGSRLRRSGDSAVETEEFCLSGGLLPPRLEEGEENGALDDPYGFERGLGRPATQRGLPRTDDVLEGPRDATNDDAPPAFIEFARPRGWRPPREGE